jgi:2-haloacid dehalogenase
LIVVFDIGNVLLLWDWRNLFRKAFDDEARMYRFLAMDWIVHTDVVADFSRAVAERAKAFPEFAEELRLFDARWIETLGGPIEVNVPPMRCLKRAGRPVHALSNFAAEKFALARQRHPFLGEFDTCVVSGDVGVAKPDPRIFEILFARVGRFPSGCSSSTTRSPTCVRGGGHGRDPLSPRCRSRKRIALAGRALP